VHEGDVVTVEGEIMHEPKASALSARDCYWYLNNLVLLTHPKQPLVIDYEASDSLRVT